MNNAANTSTSATRRALLAAAPWLAAASAASAQASPASPRPTLGGGSQGQIFRTADTTCGKVQGMAYTGVKALKGVPYGASTGGRNRFMPPKKPVPRAGVRECFAHGQINPQTLPGLRSEYEMMIEWDQHTGGMGEGRLDAQYPDPGARCGEATGDGLLPQLRLGYRIRQRPGL